MLAVHDAIFELAGPNASTPRLTRISRGQERASDGHRLPNRCQAVHYKVDDLFPD